MNPSPTRHSRGRAASGAPLSFHVMRLSRKVVALAVGILLFVSLAAFLLGTRIGVSQFMLSDAQYRASILSGELKLIKAGKVHVIADAKEIELDGELANHGRYMESHFAWLFGAYPKGRPSNSTSRGLSTGKSVRTRGFFRSAIIETGSQYGRQICARSY